MVSTARMESNNTIDPKLLHLTNAQGSSDVNASHRLNAAISKAPVELHDDSDAFTFLDFDAAGDVYNNHANGTSRWSRVPDDQTSHPPSYVNPLFLDHRQGLDSAPWTHVQALHDHRNDFGNALNNTLRDLGSWLDPADLLEKVPLQLSDAYNSVHDYWPSTSFDNALIDSQVNTSFAPELIQANPVDSTADFTYTVAVDPSMAALQNSLHIVLEDGIHRLADIPVPGSGRRGPLTQERSAAIAKKRREKAVCVRCRQMKVECRGGIPCSRCQALSKAMLWEQPCVKAHFLEIIRGGSCNYISQRTVNHLTLDGTRRVTLVLPEAFDLTELISLCKPRMTRYNFQVRQRWGPLFTIDLVMCHAFLQKISKSHANLGKRGLLAFIEESQLPGWHECIQNFDCSIDPVTLLLKWNTQPSRASYDTVTVDERNRIMPLNIEDPVHQVELTIVAQLTRIICRGLEVQAYTHLQKRLNDKTLATGEDAVAFLVKLGKVLVMLRWQISWRKLFGGVKNAASASDPMFKTFDSAKVSVPQRFTDRMDRLVLTLYYYFCSVRRQLPSFATIDELDGTMSTHGDSPPAFNDFPKLDTVNGFEDWMRNGEQLILDNLRPQTTA